MAGQQTNDNFCHKLYPYRTSSNNTGNDPIMPQKKRVREVLFNLSLYPFQDFGQCRWRKGLFD